jgi:hypothetical protein
MIDALARCLLLSAAEWNSNPLKNVILRGDTEHHRRTTQFVHPSQRKGQRSLSRKEKTGRFQIAQVSKFQVHIGNPY